MRFSVEFDSKRFIRETKYELLQRSDVTKAFVKRRDMMLREVEAIRNKHDSEVPVIPQVEYHKIAEDSEDRRDAITEKLSLTHECTWNYPWVWENWKIK